MSKKEKNKKTKKLQKQLDKLASKHKQNDYKHRTEPLPDDMDIGYDSFGIYLGHEKSGDCFVGVPKGADGNVAVIGSIGSGKTVGIAKPSIVTWNGPAFIVDTKGDLTETCQHLYKIGVMEQVPIVFEPERDDTVSYDFFAWLDQDGEDNLVQNIKDLAETFIADNPKAPEPFWNQAIQQITTAGILKYYKAGLSFPQAVAKMLSMDLPSLLVELAASDDQTVAIIAGRVKGDSKMSDAIDRGLRNHLSIFATDEHIAHAFRGVREGAVTFSWQDLETHTIILRVPLDKVRVWRPAITAFIAQLFRYLERRPEKHSAEGQTAPPILLLLGEFPRLGKIPGFTDAIATLRSKKVNIVLLMQSLAQLDLYYGEAERRVIIDNCFARVILGANDAETQQYIAELAGTRVRTRVGTSEQFNADLTRTGYGIQRGDVREYAEFPHSLSAMDDILLLVNGQAIHLEKLPPVNDLEERVIAARAAASVRKRCSTCIPDASHFGNPGACLLSVEDRLEDADRAIAAFKAQKRLEKQMRSQEQAIDKLVNVALPKAVLSAYGENRDKLLHALLVELSTDHEVVGLLGERARRIDTEQGVLKADM